MLKVFGQQNRVEESSDLERLDGARAESHENDFCLQVRGMDRRMEDVGKGIAN